MKQLFSRDRMTTTSLVSFLGCLLVLKSSMQPADASSNTKTQFSATGYTGVITNIPPGGGISILRPPNGGAGPPGGAGVIGPPGVAVIGGPGVPAANGPPVVNAAVNQSSGGNGAGANTPSGYTVTGLLRPPIGSFEEGPTGTNTGVNTPGVNTPPSKPQVDMNKLQSLLGEGNIKIQEQDAFKNVGNQIKTRFRPIIKTIPKGGKLVMGKTTHNEEVDAKSAVACYIKRICEVNKEGKKVGEKARHKHCFDNFQNEVCVTSQQMVVKYKGLKATSFNVSCSLHNSNGKVDIEGYIMEESGEIENGNETVAVGNGSVKIDVKIDWSFCGPNGSEQLCVNDGNVEKGEYLELDLHIGADEEDEEHVLQGHLNRRPRKIEKQMKREMDRYTVGNGASAAIAKQYEANGEFLTMDGDFPKVDEDGFKFRFKKFRYLRYDPVIDFDQPLESSTSSINMVVSFTIIPTLLASFISQIF